MERTGTVYVKPIQRSSWLPAGHDGEIRYTNCAEFLTVQMDTKLRCLNTGITEEEALVLEKELKMSPGTLSKYNVDYWSSFASLIPITRDGLELHLENPKDFIRYRNLLAHTEIANSEREKYESPEYKYVMTSPEQEAKIKNEKSRVIRKAYQLLGKLSFSEQKDVLKLQGKRVNNDSSEDFVESSITDLIEKNPMEFIEIVNDPMFKNKVFIQDCIANRTIIKSGSKYMLNGGDVIGLSIQEAIEYITDPNNQDVYIRLKAKVETSE